MPQSGGNTPVTSSQPTLMGYNSPDGRVVLPFFLPFTNYHVRHNGIFSPLAELPYGWEEIDDPQYGTYYVE